MNYSIELTEREILMLHEMVMGRRLAYIARDLGISLHVAQSTSKSLKDKLGADSQLQVVLFALDMRVFDPYSFWGS